MYNNPVIVEPSKKFPKYRVFLGIFILVFISSLFALVTIRVDKVILEPGSAVPTSESISINGVQTYDSKSEIRFLTVLVSANRPTLIAYLNARFIEKDNEIFDWQDINGDLSPEVSADLNRALMLSSQGAASSVALEKLGCEVPRTGTGAIIRAIEPDSPAEKSQLKVGDTIKKINGQTVTLDVDAVTEIEKFDPGEEIEVEFETSPDEKIVTTKVTLDVHPDEEKSNGFLGVYLATRDLKFKYPVDIKFDAGAVSGPSAGLAFTMQIIDELTPGDLGGSNKVAATGEIGLDGSVNRVGGVKQKAIAAREAGADLMLVPSGEGPIARQTAGNMPVYEVSTIDEALKVLAENGGDPLSQMQTCPSS